MYSTPACYYEAVKEASPKLLRKTDDFFPYASKEHSYWAGYFTSRPTLKGFIRQSTAFLQVIKFIVPFFCPLFITPTFILIISEATISRFTVDLHFFCWISKTSS